MSTALLRMKLTIIIPVFNEENTIKTILRKVVAAALPPKITKEIIVINDGSTDETSVILNSVRQRELRSFQDPKVKIFHHKINQGKGAAIKTGLKRATGDLIIIQDADLEYNPQDFKKLLRPILAGKTKVVYGTRLQNYPLILFGPHKTPHPTHLLANNFLSYLTTLLYGQKITDMETCYKLFTKSAISSIKLNSNRFDFEPEITAKLLKAGFNIIEVPIKTKPRSYKEGKKISWWDGAVALFTLIKYRFTD